MTDFFDIASLSRPELIDLISDSGDDTALYLAADKVRRLNYGNAVYIRGLIEVSNYCKNNCYYCGIRASNKNVDRYRLSKADILNCCKEGYALGFRTFVMQGGEDSSFSDEFMCDVIYSIKSLYPECAVTLSLGERSYSSYKALYDAGADRYLLRHETATESHYKRLHPDGMKLDIRKKCLFDLKKIGYQVGSGFMVGSPFQTYENLADDILFLKELQPQMIGIGPFIPHVDTPFGGEKAGTVYLTLKMLSISRLLFPKALIPSTTALSTAAKDGTELGIKAGANVVMPNLSPLSVRSKYTLYNGKAYLGSEASERLSLLKEKIDKIGYKVTIDRGDAIK